MSTAELSQLSSAQYGKANVRVFSIVRSGNTHYVVEYSVTTLLEGDIDTSYTQANNGVIVATDSIKNITYYLAKVSPHVLCAEKFALHIGTFFVSKYAHIHKAHVSIEQLRWSRIQVEEGNEEVQVKDHSHAFLRDGEERRFAKVVVDATAGKDKLIGSVSAGITGLLVLKSTGSAFEGFIKDEFTTLVPVTDRIFSTSVDLTYRFADISINPPKDDKKLEFVVPLEKNGRADGSVWDEEVPVRARKATLEVFATDESASVQATLFKMAQRVIAENAGIQDVSYALPNKHYIPVDMRYLGIDNLTPAVAEVFCPIDAPSGLISATISRK